MSLPHQGLEAATAGNSYNSGIWNGGAEGGKEGEFERGRVRERVGQNKGGPFPLSRAIGGDSSSGAGAAGGDGGGGGWWWWWWW